MRVSSHQDVRQFYEDAADGYSQMMDGEIGGAPYTDILRRLAERIVGLEGTVVDTACGPGHMLQRYHAEFDATRGLVGVDLSPRMADLAKKKIPGATVRIGDMRDLSWCDAGTVAAVLNYFALHHVDAASALGAISEWARVLLPGGQLALATWEGEGPIDYGDESDVLALRYSEADVRGWVETAGLTVDRCETVPVEGIPMDGIYLEATKPTP